MKLKIIGLTLPSPAKDFGWHDPGFIHTAVMTGLQPSSNFSYKYGRYGLSDNLLCHQMFICQIVLNKGFFYFLFYKINLINDHI